MLRFIIMLALLLLSFADAHAAATCTVTSYQIAGRRYARLALVYTDVGASGEATCAGVPSIGTVLSVKLTQTGGTGTAIVPVIGRAASFTASTQDHIATATTTGSLHVHEQGFTFYFAPGGALYVRPVPNAGSDNDITGEILVAEGAL